MPEPLSRRPCIPNGLTSTNKLTGVKINYQAVGSGAGINQITDGTVDFGASDGIMTADQQTKAEAAGGPILHIPMTSGAVAIIYNLPGITRGKSSSLVMSWPTST